MAHEGVPLVAIQRQLGDANDATPPRGENQGDPRSARGIRVGVAVLRGDAIHALAAVPLQQFVR
jgi:hypothetical protein